MKKTVLCHFYNEEYLLPWWLTHHKQIFDHGILIDYHSTDRSREIIKEICPTWDIVTSRNPDFQADNVDYEVMDIEKEIDGWRLTINITEFLMGDYSLLNDEPNQQLLIPALYFIDNNREQPVTYDLPLWEQKTFGYSYTEHNTRASRSIHNMPVAYPVPGRHYWTTNTDQLIIFYYGWAPFNAQTVARKLQIQTQIPLSDRQKNWGHHHITNEETLLHTLTNDLIPKGRNLTQEIKKYAENGNKSFL